MKILGIGAGSMGRRRLRELRHFVEAVQGKHPFTMTNLDEELFNVRVFHAVLESSEEQREIATGP